MDRGTPAAGRAEAFRSRCRTVPGGLRPGEVARLLEVPGLCRRPGDSPFLLSDVLPGVSTRGR